MNKLSWGTIRLLKIRSEKTIASIDSNANNPSMQFMSKMNCFETNLTYESQICENNNKINSDTHDD